MKEFEVNYHRRCLLIGNSRWHWAFHDANGWTFLHTPPDFSGNRSDLHGLEAWASVGAPPISDCLDPKRRLTLKDVPLNGLPPWLGIDRAFAAWGAREHQRAYGLASDQGVLVADAGTVLSLTRVTPDDSFAGGQLVAGFRLQLRAMADGAFALQDPGPSFHQLADFPLTTEEAMQKGALQALLGVIEQAHQKTGDRLWLCGGDAPILLKSIRDKGISAIYNPNLVLEGMVSVLD